MQSFRRTPAVGTSNVLTVCQVDREGGEKERGGFGEKNNIRTKRTVQNRQTDGSKGGGKDLETSGG